MLAPMEPRLELGKGLGVQPPPLRTQPVSKRHFPRVSSQFGSVTPTKLPKSKNFRVDVSAGPVRHGPRSLASELPIGHSRSPTGRASRLFSTFMPMNVTTDAIQVCGGVGFMRELPLEEWVRDAKIFQIFEGANQIQRMVIARNIQNRYFA